MPDETVPPPLASCQTFGMGEGDKTPDWWKQIFLTASTAGPWWLSRQANHSTQTLWLVIRWSLRTASRRQGCRFDSHPTVLSLQVLPAWVLPRCAGSFVLYANVWPRGKIAARPGWNPPPLKQQEVAPAHHLHQHEEDPAIIKTK